MSNIDTGPVNFGLDLSRPVFQPVDTEAVSRAFSILREAISALSVTGTTDARRALQADYYNYSDVSVPLQRAA